MGEGEGHIFFVAVTVIFSFFAINFFEHFLSGILNSFQHIPQCFVAITIGACQRWKVHP